MTSQDPSLITYKIYDADNLSKYDFSYGQEGKYHIKAFHKTLIRVICVIRHSIRFRYERIELIKRSYPNQLQDIASEYSFEIRETS